MRTDNTLKDLRPKGAPTKVIAQGGPPLLAT